MYLRLSAIIALLLAACSSKPSASPPATVGDAPTAAAPPPATAPAAPAAPAATAVPGATPSVAPDVTPSAAAPDAAPPAADLAALATPPKPALSETQVAELVKAAADFKRLLNEGRQRVKAGAYDEGLAKYREALAINPSNASVLGELGYAALQKGDLVRARAFTERALNYSRKDAQRGALLYNLGQVAEKGGDPAAAVAAYERSLAVRPHDGVRARLVSLERATAVLAGEVTVYRTLEELMARRVFVCLEYLHVWDSPEEYQVPKTLTPKELAAGVDPCKVELTQRVSAPEGHTPVTEVAVITAGTDLYTTVVLALHTAAGWIEAATLFENENSGCCGAYRDFSMTPVIFRELVPGEGLEVAFGTTWVDQDSDMGDDFVFHQSHATQVVCGLGPKVTPWCRGAHTRESDYSGSLEAFLKAAADDTTCWHVAFDGLGGYTRTPVACKDGEPVPDQPLAGLAPIRGQVMDLPSELP